jgi:hypothetical protein
LVIFYRAIACGPIFQHFLGKVERVTQNRVGFAGLRLINAAYGVPSGKNISNAITLPFFLNSFLTAISTLNYPRIKPALGGIPNFRRSGGF